MTNDCPYQITRDTVLAPAGRYLFTLEHGTRLHRVIAQRYSNAPVAPQYLRDLQARLNTRAVLDDPASPLYLG